MSELAPQRNDTGAIAGHKNESPAAFGAPSALEPEHKGGESRDTRAIWMNQR